MSEIKIPSVGRIVHYFSNGTDPAVSANGVEMAPAIVVQEWGNLTINLSVHTMNSDSPVVLRYSVPHKSTALKNDKGEILGRYWDWPEIK